MPPKRKKADPAELEQQFKIWQESDEYKHMTKLKEELKKRPKDGRISTTDPFGNDLPGDWQPVLDLVYELFKWMKVKTGKVKSIEQITIRSILFGKENKEEEIIKVDGIICGVTKEHADRCDILRHKLITDVLEKVRMDYTDWTSENYLQNKKTMTKSMQEFIKFYTQHIKPKGGGHIEIFDLRMYAVLNPLKNLIDVNAKYRKFLADNTNDTERDVKDFKLRAIEDKYILYFQDILRILYTYTPPPPILGYDNADFRLRNTPDLKKLFYKINLQGWKDSPCDKNYIEPLRRNFRKLQNTLQVMWFDKVNYWKLPLWKNTVMVEDIKALLNAEMIAERLVGAPLRRDQLNFVYKTVGVIEKSDAMVRQNLLEKDENTTEVSIPKLVIYHQIQHMRRWKDKRQEDIEKNSILSETMAELKVMKEQEEMKSPLKQAGLSLNPLPPMPLTLQKNDDALSPTKKGKDGKKIGDIVQEEEKDPEQIAFEEAELTYGRYFILEDLVSEESKKTFEECVELIRHINPAVQQDIEDKIIQEGQEPKFVSRKKDVEKFNKAKEAQNYREKLKIQEYLQTEVNAVRPPELWNYPQIVEDEHKFRAIAEPKQCYIDRRFEQFDQKLEQLKDHLCKHLKSNWDYLVDRVIDVYAGEYEEDPKNKLPDDEFHVDFPHVLKYGPQSVEQGK